MSNQSDKSNPKLDEFARWLDKELDQEQAEQFEQTISEDEALKAKLATARFIEQQVYCHEEHSVPAWDREKTFTVQKTPWWQWSGLPLTSMVCSVFAIMLVLFKVEVQVQDSGLLVSFANQQPKGLSEQALTTLVDSRLKDFASEQQLVMANLRLDIREQQQEDNLQLANYVMNTARSERKRDISDFISFINDQQSQSQFDQQMRIEQLEYAVKLQQQLALQKTNHKLDD